MLDEEIAKKKTEKTLQLAIMYVGALCEYCVIFYIS
jgi:hypothetical protein